MLPGGVVSFCRTACVDRFANVASIAALVLAPSSFCCPIKSTMSIQIFRSRILALPVRRRKRVEFLRELLFAGDRRKGRRLDVPEREPVLPFDDVQRLQHFIPDTRPSI